ncbi:TRAF3-interacting protein 1 isoform X2 [Erinaceus europaeus]|uniref:TRAF3-interacting protein 1 isoform X2 n=1 Tax=Erinaceus europaeus TaxID=9365 RepID=A0ABM3XL55_ERIEU|nr:TRAF3-interacting protein 1 isoform X2 [Erinaceus europaeus]
MNAAVVRRTQETLGKVIRRPPLTDKLLCKPPFRYLHDIVTEVIRNTGFMQGLYTDAEMKSDNVKDKEAKIRFLQKAIDVLALVSGEPVTARPPRIVAGHEPEKTNELLQLLARCCLAKLSSEDAVKRVLAGEKGDNKGRAAATRQDSDSKASREDEVRGHRDREDRRDSEKAERSSSQDHRQREDSRDESKHREKDRERHRDSEKERHREGEKEKTRARPERDRDRGARDREAERDRDRRSEGGKEKERGKGRDKPRERDKERRRLRHGGEHPGEHPRDPEQQREKGREHDRAQKSASSGELSRKLSEGSSKDTRLELEAESASRNTRSVSTVKTAKRRLRNSVEGRRDVRASEPSFSPEQEPSVCSRAKKEQPSKQPAGKEAHVPAKALEAGAGKEPEPASPAPEPGPQDSGAQPTASPDEQSAGLWRGSLEPEPSAKRRGDSTSDAEGEASQKSEGPENPEVPGDLPSSARTPRPGSARPAPPRLKQQQSTEMLTPDRMGGAKTVANVIIDSRGSDSEEDEQFVVEAGPQVAELEQVPAVEEDETHGGLVKKILETKKDYEKQQPSPRPGEKDKVLVSEVAWKKEKDVVAKEMARLRASIQTLCRSALPLGRVMDYLQEDVDAMQLELQVWRDEGRQHGVALHKEQSITNGAVEPLKAELGELEQLIREQQDKICAVKANILRNQEKIQKMVRGFNLGSRR